jgi:hypothetical protein
MRKGERKAVDEPVRLHPNAWSSLEVRLIDCSETGFRAECEARVRKYDEVTLELPGVGPVQAYVAWCRGQEFGARFVQPISIEQAKLAPAGDQQKLARLLVQRAAAQKSRLWEHEERLRKEIGKALPLRRG